MQFSYHSTHTASYYNPQTNDFTKSPKGEGYYYVGSRKVAEAIGVVGAKHRLAVFNAVSVDKDDFYNRTGWIDVSQLNSKIRCKLAKIGIE